MPYLLLDNVTRGVGVSEQEEFYSVGGDGLSARHGDHSLGVDVDNSILNETV